MSFTFAPAASFTERAGVFVSLTGGTNSGKTYSALRLARGIAGPEGKIAVLDTEGGRTLHLKRDFAFDASVMEAPFRPERFAEAAEAAERAGYAALVIDSFSMEWVGLGGVLDWQAEEHRKLGGQDSKKGQSWVKPKMAHKAMVYALLQRRIPIVFSIRGEETFVPPNTKLFKSITSKTFPFEVTVSFRLEAERKGYIDLSDPKSWKMEGCHRDIFRHGEQLGEAHGSALAAWARGEMPAPVADIAPRQSGRERMMAAARVEAAKGAAALRGFLAERSEPQSAALAPLLVDLEAIAIAADAGRMAA
ncbi:AAA family ATPase [Methylobacterium sp. J-026]|uniref:AAA family ATPase n=1 Tax=Methylobacterium sp. J-026 TaxID=2836624 RepID=UPI001FB8744A|nr:AAA family ATPase [Methylobacterium sp. J-026]MCJ2135619.1 AAA family ATPase [Methylobacterium sp. J-026]